MRFDSGSVNHQGEHRRALPAMRGLAVVMAELLPEALHDSNPLGLPRLIDGKREGA